MDDKYRHYTSRRSENNGYLEAFSARLLLCAIIMALTMLVKTAFPKGAETLSQLITGDGSYREALASIAAFGEEEPVED